MEDAWITVRRTSPEDAKQRQIIVELDDERFAEIMYGRTVTRKAAPGRHVLRVDNTWNRKQLEFELAPGEHATFLTVSRMGRFTWFLAAVFGAGPIYVSLERES